MKHGKYGDDHLVPLNAMHLGEALALSRLSFGEVMERVRALDGGQLVSCSKQRLHHLVKRGKRCRRSLRGALARVLRVPEGWLAGEAAPPSPLALRLEARSGQPATDEWLSKQPLKRANLELAAVARLLSDLGSRAPGDGKLSPNVVPLLEPVLDLGVWRDLLAAHPGTPEAHRFVSAPGSPVDRSTFEDWRDARSRAAAKLDLSDAGGEADEFAAHVAGAIEVLVRPWKDSRTLLSEAVVRAVRSVARMALATGAMLHREPDENPVAWVGRLHLAERVAMLYGAVCEMSLPTMKGRRRTKTPEETLAWAKARLVPVQTAVGNAAALAKEALTPEDVARAERKIRTERGRPSGKGTRGRRASTRRRSGRR